MRSKILVPSSIDAKGINNFNTSLLYQTMTNILQTAIYSSDRDLQHRLGTLLPMFSFQPKYIANQTNFTQILVASEAHLLIIDLRSFHEQVLTETNSLVLNTLKEPIIFIDDSTDKCLDSFHYRVIDFLVMPFDERRLLQALKKANSIISNPSSGIVLPTRLAASQPLQVEPTNIAFKNAGKIQFVSISDIYFIQASGYYLEINTAERKILLRESMGNILKRLPTTIFTRIHRSTIINLRYMQEIDKVNTRELTVLLENGQQLRVSNSYKKDLLNIINI
ncbi:MAG: hypothetical protein HKN87_05160 [Saprospiraceae bacterium]|nr:hypothetical protein [Saprospiraceae bacterium]